MLFGTGRSTSPRATRATRSGSTTSQPTPGRPGAPRPVASGYGCAAGALNNKVYVIGGAAAPQTQLTIYDIATNTWSTGNPAPAGVFLSGYQTVGNYLYIVGGFGR